mmetsp:Transcript_110056/g.172099  ORF Transcript_110056/g.172099 Transcript_110056/m.172099 type:complete len:94 (-) Transcript_110056:103-384(-)
MADSMSSEVMTLTNYAVVGIVEITWNGAEASWTLLNALTLALMRGYHCHPCTQGGRFWAGQELDRSCLWLPQNVESFSLHDAASSQENPDEYG